MASDGLYFQGDLRFYKGRASWEKPIPRMTIVQASAVVSSGSQSVGSAAHEVLRMGDVTAPSVCYVRNLSDDYAVQIGVDVGGTFYPLLELEPGDDLPLVGRFCSSAAVYVKGNGGAVEIELAVFQKDA